jgi:pimeloyl-ACP methyl ester carboxylesterase
MDDAREPRLVMLPGMGCDGRLFYPQRRGLRAVGRIEVPRWLPASKGETFADYARRMAELVDTGEPFYLGGISMGGMVALEMARHLRPKAVLLIGASRSGAGVVDVLHGVERDLSPFVRPWMIDWCKPLSPLIVAGLPQDLKDFMVNMFEDTDAKLIRWGCSAIVHWPGPPPGEPRTRVYEIHGERDWLLPVEKTFPDHVVRGGGHLINLTHAEEVNAWIKARVEEVERTSRIAKPQA